MTSERDEKFRKWVAKIILEARENSRLDFQVLQYILHEICESPWPDRDYAAKLASALGLLEIHELRYLLNDARRELKSTVDEIAYTCEEGIREASAQQRGLEARIPVEPPSIETIRERASSSASVADRLIGVACTLLVLLWTVAPPTDSPSGVWAHVSRVKPWER